MNRNSANLPTCSHESGTRQMIVNVYVCVYIYIYIYTVYVHLCMCMCVRACVRVCVCVCRHQVGWSPGPRRKRAGWVCCAWGQTGRCRAPGPRCTTGRRRCPAGRAGRTARRSQAPGPDPAHKSSSPPSVGRGKTEIHDKLFVENVEND